MPFAVHQHGGQGQTTGAGLFLQPSHDRGTLRKQSTKHTVQPMWSQYNVADISAALAAGCSDKRPSSRESITDLFPNEFITHRLRQPLFAFSGSAVLYDRGTGSMAVHLLLLLYPIQSNLLKNLRDRKRTFFPLVERITLLNFLKLVKWG